MLALVAEGRSNGEIGRALFISTKTASVHVSNILAKLGAASRGEAVAVARTVGPARRLSAAQPTGRQLVDAVAASQREDAVGQAHHEQAGAEHVRDDQRLGQAGEVLHVADQALRQGDHEHDQPGPARPRARRRR